MIGTFPGKLSFADGDEVDVDLEIAAGQLKLVTGISEIGSWPLEVCSLAPDARDAFNLIVDGDRVRFSPDHPDAFTQFVAQLGSHALSSGRTNGGSNGGARSSPGAHEVPAGAESTSAASDEEIALTLEALFASAFTDDDGDAPGPPTAAHHAAPVEAGPPAVEPPAPSSTGAADPAPVDDLWAPSPDVAGDDPSGSSGGAGGGEPAAGPWDGDDDVIATGGWSTGDMEVEEWSPEATAAALEAELARSRPTSDPPAPPPGDSPTAVGEQAASGDPTDTVDRPAAHWRDYDPLGEENDVPEPASGDLPPTASDRLEEPVSDPVADHDHFSPPPRGYGDDAFDPRAGDPLADEGPWADIPDDVMIPGDSVSDAGDDDPDDGASADRGWFRSTATERLASVADAIKERGEAEGEEDPDYSVADEIRASQQKLRSSGRRRDVGRLVKRIGIPLLVVVVLGGLALFTPRVIELLAERIDAAEEDIPAVDAGEDPAVDAEDVPVDQDQDPEPGDAAPPEPVPAVETTVPAPQTTPTTAPPISIFDMPASEFVLRWNDVGTSVSPRFEIPGDLGDDLFAQGLTEYVGIEGRLGEDGTVDGFTVIVDPRGEPQDDQLGIQALGVAIGVVDPSTTGVDRRDLLMELGLDVSEPDLGGIDSEVTRNGVAYRLVFDDDSFLLRFTLSPAGATPPPPQEADQDAEAAEPAG